MIETEIKVKIDDLEQIRNKISNLKGKYIISLHHEDTYFNMPEGLRDFKITDEALRIRTSTEFMDKSKDHVLKVQNYITYKGKKLDNLTKTRKELEVKIDDSNKMKEILIGLGFKEILTVIKEREAYEFNFNGNHIELLLDFIPLLNMNFMEVELLVESIEDVDPAKNVLFTFLKQFGIDKSSSIRKSYLELIME